MSIVVGAINNLHEIGELLKEWSGKPYSSDFVLFNSRFIGARDNKKLVAIAQYIGIPDPFFQRKWMLIENVFVLPEYRRQGLASQIMKQILEQARIEDYEFVKLTTRKEGGKALYRSLGMEEGSAFYMELR
jgi:GNAT superfamily N-acetyltransferase